MNLSYPPPNCNAGNDHFRAISPASNVDKTLPSSRVSGFVTKDAAAFNGVMRPFGRDLVSVLTSFAIPLIGYIRMVAMLTLICALCGCNMFTTPPRVGLVMNMVPALPDHCSATPLLPLVGQPFTALANQPDLAELRVVWPEQEVTSELRGRRLNAMVDNDGRILRLFCG